MALDTEIPEDCSSSVDFCAVNPCKNEGFLDVDKCICQRPYEGQYCELLANSVPGNVTYAIRVTVKIENRNYTIEMANRSSETFMEFSKEFNKQMQYVYGHIRGYQTVEITMTSQGSIITDHKAIFNDEAERFDDSMIKETVKDIKDSLQFKNCTNSNDSQQCSGLQLAPNYKNVSYTNQDVTVDCSTSVKDNFKDEFTAVNTTSGWICVSRCHSGHKDHLRCQYGKCELTEKGPKCFCNTSKDYWYIGENCQFPVQKLAFIIVTVLVVLIIIVTLIVLIVYCTRYRHMVKQNHLSREKTTNQILKWWEEDNWEWPASQGLTLSNLAAADIYSLPRYSELKSPGQRP
ncbi:mucin-17-like [Rhincodon typus]|uniref:mucin-17-like n=1 Tax=Rhincodon typus TaxID=259920 RepID=UPI00202DDE92|nr:mucin-17-like [Rhincodon typus]